MHPISLKVKKTRRLYAFWLAAIIAVLIMTGCGGGSSGGGGGGGGTVPIPTTGELQVAIDSVEVVDCEEIWVFFNVVGPDDNVVVDLTVNDISLFVDGQPDEVTSLEFIPLAPVNQPISIVFVLDYSSSMLDTAIDTMAASVEKFILDMQDSGQVSYAKIIKFASRIFPFPEAPGQFADVTEASEINPLSDFLSDDFPVSRSGTNIYDAVFMAIENLKVAPTDRVAVVLLTDGEQTVANSDYILGDVIGLATSDPVKVPIYSIGLMDKDIFTEDDIKQMANETNGLYFRTPSNELSEKYEQISKFLLIESNVIIFSQDELSNPEDPHEVRLLVSLGGLSDSDEMEFDFNTICP
jgi:hypothetical protein